MGIVKTALGLSVVLSSLACPSARADQAGGRETQPPAQQPATPQERASAQDADQPVQPDAARKPAQRRSAQRDAKNPAPRRSVQQVIETMPPAQATPEPYRPTLTPRGPTVAVPSPSPTFGLPSAAEPPRPSGPVQINSCDAGGCTDINGVRHNGGVGTTLIDSNGRSCTRSGVTAQCF